jgi:DNA-binding ferritin-like protein
MNRINKLAECTDAEMVDIISSEVLGDDRTGDVVDVITQAVTSVAGETKSGDSELLKKRMSQYIAMLRGMQLWYHAAHHVTRGASFFSDHADAFGKLYQELTRDFDEAVEKAIGLTDDEEMACPVQITKMACQVICKYPSPVSLTSLAMASCALEMEKNHNQLVTAIFHELEDAGCLTLGLDDMLMATVNDHEGHIYMLQQRVKTELEN